jgi:hypothetical protein
VLLSLFARSEKRKEESGKWKEEGEYSCGRIPTKK